MLTAGLPSGGCTAKDAALRRAFSALRDSDSLERLAAFKPDFDKSSVDALKGELTSLKKAYDALDAHAPYIAKGFLWDASHALDDDAPAIAITALLDARRTLERAALATANAANDAEQKTMVALLDAEHDARFDDVDSGRAANAGSIARNKQSGLERQIMRAAEERIRGGLDAREACTDAAEQLWDIGLPDAAVDTCIEKAGLDGDEKKNAYDMIALLFDTRKLHYTAARMRIKGGADEQ